MRACGRARVCVCVYVCVCVCVWGRVRVKMSFISMQPQLALLTLFIRTVFKDVPKQRNQNSFMPFPPLDPKRSAAPFHAVQVSYAQPNLHRMVKPKTGEGIVGNTVRTVKESVYNALHATGTPSQRSVQRLES